ncbi:MAG: conjugal transfer protein TraX [Clostridium sp.]|nr:conjugal transfer protein TraX [Clostridium sp.]MCM1547905.1 conjugal transfer protein TraX [Ruminococcus sp.]
MAIDISNRPDRPSRKVYFAQRKKSGLSSDVLKVIAIIAMVIDHIAWAFVPFGSIAGQAMHVVGRITAPIMCFMAAEGYYRTRDPIRYAKRLGLFALISHMPYVYFESGSLNPIHTTSVMLPLFLGVLALIIQDSSKIENGMKSILFIVICIISCIGDWNTLAVLWIYFFYSFRNDKKRQMKYFCIVSAVMIVLSTILCASMGRWYNDLFQFGVFLAVPLLMKYNGVRKSGKTGKWFFYIFYPAHLALLAVMKYL